MDDRELKIAATELAQDFHDWPTGHIAFRQQEADALPARIHWFVGPDLMLEEREQRIRLRHEHGGGAHVDPGGRLCLAHIGARQPADLDSAGRLRAINGRASLRDERG
jgi:hypothetical protein